MQTITLNSQDAKSLHEWLIANNANDRQQQYIIKAVNQLGELPSNQELLRLLQDAA